MLNHSHYLSLLVNMNQSFKVRRLTLRHCFFLFKLRNSDSSRKWFANQNQVRVSEHLIWFIKLITKPGSIAFVCEQGGLNLGVIYICRDSNSAMISVNVAEEYRSMGVASKLLASVQREARRKKIASLFAKVKKDNIASINLFLSENFFISHQDSEFFFFKKNV